MKAKHVFIGIAIFFGLLIVGKIIGFGSFMISESTQVAKEQFGPQAMLKKYEWFKNASHRLDAMSNDITMYQAKIDQVCTKQDTTYMQQNCMLWEQESIGIRAQFNNLVAEYNAASAKFNWSMFKTEDVNIPRAYEQF